MKLEHQLINNDFDSKNSLKGLCSVTSIASVSIGLQLRCKS